MPLRYAVLLGAAAALPRAPLPPTSLALGGQVDAALAIGASRSWTFVAPDTAPFTAQASMTGGGDVSLTVCNDQSLECRTVDGSFASATEKLTVDAVSDPVYGGAAATYSITVRGMGDKETTPNAARFSLTLVAGTSALAPVPSPASAVPWTALFPSTTVAQSTTGGATFFRFSAAQSTAIAFTATSVAGGELELSLNTVLPTGSGLDWTAFTSALSAGQTMPALLSAQPSDGFFMGANNGGVGRSFYVLRVASTSGAEVQFSLRAEYDPAVQLASPTPTPSPSAAPLSPATPLLPVEPLTLDANPVRDSLGLAAIRSWSYVATTEADFSVVADNSMGGGSGDVSLTVCGESDCETKDSSFASAKEVITVGPGSKLWGGLGATYSITVTALSAKQSTPQVANHIVYVSSQPSGGGASPSPSAAPPSVDLFEVFLDTSIAETVGGGDPSVRFFQLRAWLAGYGGGITATITVTDAVPVDVEVALGVAAPWGAGLSPVEWRPLLVGATSASTGGSATAVLAVPPGSPAYMGTAQQATYYVRVRSATAAKASFLLRIASDPSPLDSGIAASPTPTPSPSAAPLSPATPLLPVEPLTLDANPVRDSLGLAAIRSWSYVATTEADFSVVADNSMGGGSGDVSLTVCGESDCETKDSSFASAKEVITVGPGSKLWGGLGATYSITVTALSAKQSTPQVANHIVYVSSQPSGGGASPSPAPMPPATTLYNAFFDTSIAEVVGGSASGIATARFFALRPGAYSPGFTVTLSVTGAADVEVALGVAAPWGSGLSPIEWRPLLAGATGVGSGGSATVALGVAPGSIAYLGTGAMATYYIRVRSVGADAAAQAPFLLRVGTYATPPSDFAVPATPTPSPSASPAPPGAMIAAPVQPLTFKADFVDAVGVTASRTFSYQHASNEAFSVFVRRGSGDPVLTVCGESDCEPSDGTYASSDESVFVSPGSKLWGGIGASYTITVYNTVNKITTPQVCNYVIGAYDVVPAAPPTASPGPLAAPVQLFEGTEIGGVMASAGEDWYFFSPPPAAAGPWAIRATNNEASGTLAMDIGPVPRPGVGRPGWLSHSRAYATSGGGAGDVTFGDGDAWFLPPSSGQQLRIVYVRIVGAPGASYKIQAILTAPSATPSTTPTESSTGTPSMTQAPFVTPSGSPTASESASLSSTNTATTSASGSSTVSASATPSVTQGASPSDTPSQTPSVSDTATGTPTPTRTRTSSPTPTSALSGGASPSATPAATPSGTPSRTASASASPTASLSRGASASITPSASPTASETPTASLSVLASPSATPSASPSGTPTGSLSTLASPSTTPSGPAAASPTGAPSSASASPSRSQGAAPLGAGAAAQPAADTSGATVAGILVPLIFVAVGITWYRRSAKERLANEQAAAAEGAVTHRNPMVNQAYGAAARPNPRQPEAWGESPRRAAV